MRHILDIIEKNSISRNPVLDLGNCGLVKFPKRLLQCHWLKEIILSNEWWDYEFDVYRTSINKGLPNSILSIPVMQPVLENLEILRLGGLPGKLTNIEGLSNLRRLPKLEELDLNFIQITDKTLLPSNRTLRKLYLAGNTLSSLDNIPNYKHIRSLDISYGKTVDCRAVARLVGLRNLYLNNCRLQNTRYLSKLYELKKLNVSECYLSDVSFVENLTLLERLDVSGNSIENLEGLLSLQTLETLNISGNGTLDLGTIQRSNRIKDLNVSANNIKNPEAIGLLEELVYLDISLTDIVATSFISKLINLESLSIRYNEVMELSFLNSLTKINYLDCSYNNIADLETLFSIIPFGPKIKVELKNNPVERKIPYEVRQVGWSAIHERLLALQRNEEFVILKEAKLLILGNPNVGKSNLLEYLDTNLEPKVESATHGVQFRMISEAVEDTTLNCWDFGGQDYYHATHQLFFTPGALHIILWSKEDIVRHDGELCFDLNYWLRTIDYLTKRYSDRMRNEVIVCENKIDLNLFLPTSLNQQKIIEQFSDLNIVFTYLNLQPLKYIAGFKDLVKGRSELLFNSYQRKYHEYLRVLRQASGDYLLISEIDAHHPEIKDSAIKIFHYLGVLLYFPQIVPDIVFIKPNKLLNFLYNNIFTKSMIDSGKYSLTKRALSETIKANSLGLSGEEVIKLLEYFNLVFQIRDTSDRYFFPQFLPKPSQEIMRVVQTKFGAPNILIQSDRYLMNLAMLKLYSEYGKCVMRTPRNRILLWKNSIVIEKNELQVLIHFDQKANRLELFSVQDKMEAIYLQSELVDFILNVDILDGNHAKLSKNKDIQWQSDKYDVFVRGISGYFVSWNELVITVKEGGSQIRGYEMIPKDGILPAQKFIFIEEYKQYLPNKLKARKSVFICYAHQNTSQKNDLVKYMSNLISSGLLELWEDAEIHGGEEWDSKIKQKLGQSDIGILLISQDLIKSSYVNQVELKNVMARRAQGLCHVIPVLISHCDWQHWIIESNTSSSKSDESVQELKTLKSLQLLPIDKNRVVKPVNKWKQREYPWMQVIESIRNYC